MFFNVGKAMTDMQTYDTAMLIVETYPMLNVADINFVFKQAKLGRFGKLYDRLDGAIILDWFEQYLDRRCNAAAERSISEAHKHKFSADDRDRASKVVDRMLGK